MGKALCYDEGIESFTLMTPAILKETMDHLPGGLLITDQESRVLYASAALEQRTGFSVAEIVGKKPGELWGGKMRKQFYASLWRTIGGKGQSFVGEVNNTKKNGARKDEHIFIVPIRDQAGVAQYYAEIHPELSGRESELAFGREFLARTNNAVQDKSFFSWVFQTLRKKRDGTLLGTESTFWQGDFEDAASFLKESFIAPMEKLFIRRKEDALLVARAQENPEQFALLFEKYAPAVREYFSRRLGGDLALAEDLTQEVFVRSFRSLRDFHMANASYYTYLLHVAHNVLVNHYRTQRYETISLSGNEPGIEDRIENTGIVRGDLDTLLKGCTETERSVMLWKYRDTLRVREIAKRLGKTENAVKLVLSRTRKKLKKTLV